MKSAKRILCLILAGMTWATAPAAAETLEQQLQSYVSSGDTLSINSLISEKRSAVYQLLQRELESILVRESSQLDPFYQGLSERLATAFDDRFYTGQIARYSQWTESQKAKRRELGDSLDRLLQSERPSNSEDLIRLFSEIADSYLALGDSVAAAKVYQNASLLLSGSGDHDSAERMIERSFAICRPLGDLVGLSRSYNLMGSCKSKAGDLLAAGSYFDSARVIRTELADELGLAESLNNIGNVYLELGEQQRARDFFAESYRLRLVNRDSTGAASVLLNMLSAYRSQEPISVLEQWLEQCRMLAGDSEDRVLLARIEQASGILTESKGVPEEALNDYRRALALLSERERPGLRLSLQVNIARLQNRLGQYAEALAGYLAALDLAREVSNPGAESNILQNLAVSFQRLGDYQAALDYYSQALAVQQKLTTPCDAADILTNSADLSMQVGDENMARNQAEQLEQTIEQCADPLVKARAYTLLRHWHPEYLDSAAAIYEQLDNKQGLFDLAILKADQLRRRERYDAALQTLASVASVNVIIDDYSNLQKYDLNRGLIFSQAGSFDSAYIYLKAVIQRLEQSRSELPVPELRTSQLSRNRYVYEQMALLFLRQHKPGETAMLDSLYFYMQSAKARTLLDELHQRDFDELGSSSFTQSSAERELTEAIAKTEGRMLAAVSDEERDLLSEKLSSLSEQLAELRLRAKLKNSQTLQLYRPLPDLLNTMRSEIPPGNLLLDYLLTPDETILLAITDSSVTLHSLAGRSELVGEVIEYLQLLRNSVSDESLLDRFASRQAEISDVLLGDLAAGLDGFTSVFVCTDGPLAAFPFDALQIDDHYLIEQADLTILPATVFLKGALENDRLDHSAKLLAVADPEFDTGLVSLPYSRKEAEWVASTFPEGDARVLQGADAAKSVLLSDQVSSYDILHFATHSTVSHSDSWRSRLWLARDTTSAASYLTLDEIVALDLEADLVVLSSCESGSGRYSLGEGFEGFVKGFMLAGVDNVIVSLWPVEDFTTSVFMKRFYQHLGDGYAKALRLAKLELLESPRRRHHHPYYWSSFVLVAGPGKR